MKKRVNLGGKNLNIIEKFINWAIDNKWDVRKNSENEKIFLKENITKRYLEIPQDFIKFISTVEYCISPNEKIWFICSKEYNEISDFAFAWNEFEMMSFIEDEKEYNEEVKNFWDIYLPIMISVENGYKYYAIDTKLNFGTVISGQEPEFEEYDIVSSSFSDFLEMIINNRI